MKKILSIILITACLACGCSSASDTEKNASKSTASEPESIDFFAMDTTIKFSAYGDKKVLKGAKKVLTDLEKKVSVTDSGSEIYHINQNGSGTLTGDVSDLMQKALQMCTQTDGALDISIYPIVKASGTYDADKFASGNYCLAIGPAIEAGNDIPTYSVGEKIKISDREFEVMAVLIPLQPMVDGTHPVFDLPLVLPADTFQELWPENHLRKYYFNIADENMGEAYSLLKDYQQGSSVGMNVVSRQTMIEQYEAETRAAAVMGYAVSIIIALVGVLNFINSMVTAIITRKREFAMIQSIGMTKRQLRKMLMFEGLYYAGMTLLASYVLGSLTVGVIVRALVAGGYSTFHFTLLPLVICTPILIVFAIVIPYICFKNLEKQSIVERLRATD